jgi:DNA-binding response OmpR family regulator
MGETLPFVIITAFDEHEARVQCLAAGAAAYLLKPFDDQALLAAIDRAVGTEMQCNVGSDDEVGERHSPRSASVNNPRIGPKSNTVQLSRAYYRGQNAPLLLTMIESHCAVLSAKSTETAFRRTT